SSLPISIHEGDAAGSGFSPLLLNQLPGGEQQQTGDPTTTGPNGAPRIAVPVNNMLGWGYNGIGAPEGLMGMGWQEPLAQNSSIESTIASSQVTPIILKNVPVADYHGGGSIPSTANGGGGIYGQRFVDDWVQVTDGNTVLPTDDGL